MKCVNIYKVPRKVLRTQALNALIILVVMVVGISFIIMIPHYTTISSGQELSRTEKPCFSCKAVRQIGDGRKE